MESEKQKDFLSVAQQRFKESVDGWAVNESLAIEDLKFLSGEGQWPDNIKAERAAAERPCLTINQLPKYVDVVVGEMRQNKPSIKVRPVDSGADVEIAKIYTGLIRNIEQTSSADVAYITAAEQACRSGYGFFRVITEYSQDDSFDQDIKFRRIKNPFTVKFDPHCNEADFSDARYCFISEIIPLKDYEARYPGKAAISNNESSEGESDEAWYLAEQVRIAEYFYREPYKKTIALLSTGEVVELKKGMEDRLAAIGVEIVKQRTVDSEKIMWCMISGKEVLEGPQEWPGRYIPVIPVIGREMNIEGKTVYHGIIRPAKDSQTMYNYWRTTAAERVALTPRVPYMLTPQQIEGHEALWKACNKTNFPYLLYNSDPTASQPNRVNVVESPVGLTNEAQISIQEIRDTTGIYEANIGKTSNETSGRAILARQRAGDNGTFAFVDNLALAVRHAGRILIDLIPKIYDTERVVRVIGEDGKEALAEINKTIMTPEGPALINDITTGKYDVVVTVGPGYATQRLEAVESMTMMLQTAPSLAPILIPRLMKAFDWPGADEIAEELERNKQVPPSPLEEAQIAKIDAEIKTIMSTGILNLAKAEGEEAGIQLQAYKQAYDQLTQALQANGIAPPPMDIGQINPQMLSQQETPI